MRESEGFAREDTKPNRNRGSKFPSDFFANHTYKQSRIFFSFLFFVTFRSIKSPQKPLIRLII